MLLLLLLLLLPLLLRLLLLLHQFKILFLETSSPALYSFLPPLISFPMRKNSTPIFSEEGGEGGRWPGKEDEPQRPSRWQ